MIDTGNILATESETNESISLSHVSVFVTMKWRLLGSSVSGIIQARILEWVAIPVLQGIFLTQGCKPVPLH